MEEFEVSTEKLASARNFFWFVPADWAISNEALLTPLTAPVQVNLFQKHLFLQQLKFIFSEKATKFCEISTNYLSYVLPVKWLVEVLQNFLAFAAVMTDAKKVHIFWEGHTILQNLNQFFDWQYIGQIIGGDFAKFFGLLRIYEL